MDPSRLASVSHQPLLDVPAVEKLVRILRQLRTVTMALGVHTLTA